MNIDLLRWVIRRLGLRIVYVFRRPHVAGFRPPENLLDLEFRFLTKEELKAYAADPGNELRPGFVDSALQRGDVCVGAVRDGFLIAYTWWTDRQAREAEGRVLVTIAPTDNYGYRGFVRPEYRGQGIYDALVFACGQSFIDKGKTHTTYVVGMGNFANLKVQKKVGVEPVGMAGYARVFGRYLTFRTPGARTIGFRFASLPREKDGSY